MVLIRFVFMAWSTASESTFRSTWHCLIVKVLANWANFLESSCYCAVINWTFNFSLINVFGWFRGVVAQFELVKIKFLNHVALSSMRLSNTKGSFWWFFKRHEGDKPHWTGRWWALLVLPEWYSSDLASAYCIIINHIYPTPPLGQDMTLGQFLSGV